MFQFYNRPVAYLPQVATPTFAPGAGTYSSAQSVAITCATPQSSIYYTTDGSTPTYPITGTTQPYSGPVSVNASETLNAIAIAIGYTQPSAEATAAYVISSGGSSNFIGANLSCGGGSYRSNEDIPLWKNRVREGRGFTTGNNTTYITYYDANGWPQQDFTCVLYDGGRTPSWGTANGGVFLCGFIDRYNGTSTATPSAFGGCSVSNIVRGAVGTYTTFTLTVTNMASVPGFSISGTGNGAAAGSTYSGATQVFCYLPEYASMAPAAGTSTPIETWASAAAITTEAAAFYGQFHHLRLGEWTNCCSNTGVNTSATIRNQNNTQTNAWSTFSGQQGLINEGYPSDVAAQFCISANAGMWYHVPALGDGVNGSAGSYETALFNLIKTKVVPAGLPIYIEWVNEI